MGVISRYPLVQNTRQRLSPARPVPLLTRLFSPAHTVQMVDVQCGTQTLRLFSVYSGAHDSTTRQRQVRELVDFVRQAATPLSVLIGAFNTASWRTAGEGRDTNPSAEQTMRLVLDDLSGRFRAVVADEQPAPATASRVSVPHILIGSGMRAVETHLIPLPESISTHLPLVVHLRWALPLVISNGRSQHERL
jgi:endonuclease/exonuclease/phosphatase family metal-dependent hydrolase